MLDSGNHHGVIDALWQSSQNQTELPACLRDAQEPVGHLPINPDTRRAFSRLYLRRPAILVIGRSTYGVFVKDISKGGLGFFGPFQMFPRDQAWLVLSEDKKVQVEVRRCRRLDASCYECGANFISGDHGLPRFLSELTGAKL